MYFYGTLAIFWLDFPSSYSAISYFAIKHIFNFVTLNVIAWTPAVNYRAAVTQLFPIILSMLEWSLSGHCMFALNTLMWTSKFDWRKPWMVDISNLNYFYHTNPIQVFNLHWFLVAFYCGRIMILWKLIERSVLVMGYPFGNRKSLGTVQTKVKLNVNSVVP